MASLRRKHRSPFWFACFTLPGGKRVQRSTKETKRKNAQEQADEWEELAQKHIKAKQAHRVIADIYKSVHGHDLPSSTVRAFLNGWLQRRKGEVKPASFATYSARVRDFLAWLDAAADGAMGNLTTDVFVRYRDNVASRLTVTTANQAVKVLRSMFEDGRRDGYIADNPSKDVRPLKSAVAMVKRRPFTIEELKAVLALADEEWRSMILFGVYTGQRLADLARLRWSNLDLVQQEIRLQTAKTGRVVIIPLPDPLKRHIGTLQSADSPEAYVHPRAASHFKKATGQVAALSRQFADILSAAGLRQRTTHEAKKSGRAGRHEVAALSFHSLRHTATSLMKNAGISPAIVQDIIGHQSAEISAHYTHVESAAKLIALNTLPDLTYE